MDAFGYLSVLISIILGLGVTQLLTGIGRLIQGRGRVRMYAPAVTWAVILLLVHVQSWWTMFGLRDVREWNFAGFSIVLLQPVVLYLLTALVLPDLDEPDTADLRANYHDQARWFFGLFVVLLVVSIAKDLVVGGSLPELPNLLAHLVFMGLAIAAMITPDERYHRAQAPIVAGLFGLYIAGLFWRLG